MTTIMAIERKIMQSNDIIALKIKIPTLSSFAGALCAGAVYLLAGSAPAQNLYVAMVGNGTVGEYGLDGSTINASLISGLDNNSYSIAISGNDLFVGGNNVGEYTTSGAAINTSLISGL